MSVEGQNPTVNRSELIEFFASSLYRRDNPERALYFCQKILEIGKFNFSKLILKII